MIDIRTIRELDGFAFMKRYFHRVFIILYLSIFPLLIVSLYSYDLIAFAVVLFLAIAILTFYLLSLFKSEKRSQIENLFEAFNLMLPYSFQMDNRREVLMKEIQDLKTKITKNWLEYDNILSKENLDLNIKEIEKIKRKILLSELETIQKILSRSLIKRNAFEALKRLLALIRELMPFESKKIK